VWIVIGGVAQLGERLLCKQEVIGSIPFTSTNSGREREEFGSERTVGLLASGLLSPEAVEFFNNLEEVKCVGSERN
jgi:hypothetical protein